MADPTSTIDDRSIDVTGEEPVPTVDRRPQILLVDDRAERLALMQRLVEDGARGGQVVARAATAEAAMAAVLTHHVDVALVELQMAGSAGLAIITALHASDSELVVVACSFRSGAGSRLQAVAAGATVFLGKPISTHDIHTVCVSRRWTSRHLDATPLHLSHPSS